jgi:Zn/Cd-binding protein ZinT
MVKLSEMKVGNRSIYVQQYASLKEMYEYLRNTPITSVFKNKASINGEYSFTKTRSYEQAEQLLLNGWDEGSKKLTTSLKIANAKIQPKEVKRNIYDIVGFRPSVPRYLQGDPLNMINQKKVKQKQKVVTIIKACNYLGNVKPEEILEDSVKFLQIVQAIEAQGIRVNVDIISSSYAISTGQETFIRVPIKKASERLNISKISFPLLHPSFLRRFMFRAREVDTRLTDPTWGYGYGRPVEPDNVRMLLTKGEYFIPNLVTEKQALEAISNIGTENK